jgi:hypothetical protein
MSYCKTRIALKVSTDQAPLLKPHIQGFAAVVVMLFVVIVLWPQVVREKCGLNLVDFRQTNFYASSHIFFQYM